MARFRKGTHPTLTSALISALCETIEHGAYVETAAALCGISKDSFYRWLRQAESDEATDLTLKLSDAVKKAMAQAELRDLAVIDGAAQTGIWQAAAWRLERKHPERWGRQSQLRQQEAEPLPMQPSIIKWVVQMPNGEEVDTDDKCDPRVKKYEEVTSHWYDQS